MSFFKTNTLTKKDKILKEIKYFLLTFKKKLKNPAKFMPMINYYCGNFFDKDYYFYSLPIK